MNCLKTTEDVNLKNDTRLCKAKLVACEGVESWKKKIHEGTKHVTQIGIDQCSY